LLDEQAEAILVAFLSRKRKPPSDLSVMRAVLRAALRSRRYRANHTGPQVQGGRL